jgi:hypothetical protein
MASAMKADTVMREKVMACTSLILFERSEVCRMREGGGERGGWLERDRRVEREG